MASRKWPKIEVKSHSTYERWTKNLLSQKPARWASTTYRKEWFNCDYKRRRLKPDHLKKGCADVCFEKLKGERGREKIQTARPRPVPERGHRRPLTLSNYPYVELGDNKTKQNKTKQGFGDRLSLNPSWATSYSVHAVGQVTSTSWASVCTSLKVGQEIVVVWTCLNAFRVIRI